MKSHLKSTRITTSFKKVVRFPETCTATVLLTGLDRTTRDTLNQTSREFSRYRYNDESRGADCSAQVILLKSIGVPNGLEWSPAAASRQPCRALHNWQWRHRAGRLHTRVQCSGHQDNGRLSAPAVHTRSPMAGTAQHSRGNYRGDGGTRLSR